MEAVHSVTFNAWVDFAGDRIYRRRKKIWKLRHLAPLAWQPPKLPAASARETSDGEEGAAGLSSVGTGFPPPTAHAMPANDWEYASPTEHVQRLGIWTRLQSLQSSPASGANPKVSRNRDDQRLLASSGDAICYSCTIAIPTGATSCSSCGASGVPATPPRRGFPSTFEANSGHLIRYAGRGSALAGTDQTQEPPAPLTAANPASSARSGLHRGLSIMAQRPQTWGPELPDDPIEATQAERRFDEATISRSAGREQSTAPPNEYRSRFPQSIATSPAWKPPPQHVYEHREEDISGKPVPQPLQRERSQAGGNGGGARADSQPCS